MTYAGSNFEPLYNYSFPVALSAFIYDPLVAYLSLLLRGRSFTVVLLANLKNGTICLVDIWMKLADANC